MTYTDWHGRRVLITGGTGFAGRRLASRLIELGAQVHFLARRPANMPGSVSHLGAVEDAEAVTEAVCSSQPEVVYHLAAQPLVNTARMHPVETFETNIRGTWLLLDACRRHIPEGTLVLASSDAVYGDQRTRPCDETHPLDGRHPYEASKACADILAQTYALTYAMRVGIARLSNLFGPGDLNWSRIVPGTMRAALFGETPVIRSDGSPLRDYLHIDDLVSGLLALADYASTHAGAVNAFNFASGKAVSVLDMTRLVLSATGRADIQPRVLAEETGEIRHKELSVAAAKERLAWAPAADLGQRLAETAVWYRAHLKAD